MERKPLFRNCPYEDVFERKLKCDCRNCSNYEKCIEMKARRRKEKKAAQKLVSVSENNESIQGTNPVLIFMSLLILAWILAMVFILLEPKDDVIDTNNTYTSTFSKSSSSQSEVLIPETIYPVTDENAGGHVQVIKPIEVDDQDQQTTQKVEGIVKEEIPTISALKPGNLYYYVISDSDKKEIEKLLYKEARGEPYEGKVAVAAVVLNRYVSGDKQFDTESIHSVITQSGAFASISDVTQEMLDTVPDLKLAVEDACHGWDPTRAMFENGALFFYAPGEVYGYQAQIRENIDYLPIGGHNFHIKFNA